MKQSKSSQAKGPCMHAKVLKLGCSLKLPSFLRALKLLVGESASITNIHTKLGFEQFDNVATACSLSS